MTAITAIADGNTTQTWANALNALITSYNLIDTGIIYIAPTLAGSFTNVGGAQDVAGYGLDPSGLFLHIKGLVTGGTGTVFTLATGYRPALYQRYDTVGGGAFAWIEVRNDGIVTLGGGSGTNLSLLSPPIPIRIAP